MSESLTRIVLLPPVWKVLGSFCLFIDPVIIDTSRTGQMQGVQGHAFSDILKSAGSRRKLGQPPVVVASLGKCGMLHSLGVPPQFVILRISLQKNVFLSTFPSLL